MNPTRSEKLYWSRLVSTVGCIACRLDGTVNNHVSIHHINGRTRPGAHMQVLPLCAGHHQDGTDNDKTKIAVHPWKRRFEAQYGTQEWLKAKCNEILKGQGW